MRPGRQVQGFYSPESEFHTPESGAGRSYGHWQNDNRDAREKKDRERMLLGSHSKGQAANMKEVSETATETEWATGIRKAAAYAGNNGTYWDSAMVVADRFKSPMVVDKFRAFMSQDDHSRAAWDRVVWQCVADMGLTKEAIDSALDTEREDMEPIGAKETVEACHNRWKELYLTREYWYRFMGNQGSMMTEDKQVKDFLKLMPYEWKADLELTMSNAQPNLNAAVRGARICDRNSRNKRKHETEYRNDDRKRGSGHQ